MRLTSVMIFLAIISFIANAQADDKLPVIELTQTGCQFLQPEGIDHQYKTKREADCAAINSKENVDKRLKSAKVMKLKPGKYVFRVANKDVPYELGFWLRGQGLKRFIMPSISGAGLTAGVSKDYVIELKPGKYVYSCPLNPTPDYSVIVE